MLRPFFTALLTIELVISMAPTPHIDWCLYWRYLNKDQFRPECNGVYRLRFAKHKAHDHRRVNTPTNIWTPAFPLHFKKFSSYIPTSNSIIIGADNDNFGECQASNTNCQRSNQCASGQLCIDNNGYCCGVESIPAKCPSPETLAPHCSFHRRGVNWCDTDSECAPHLAPRHNLYFYRDDVMLDSSPTLCCPTKCGYNVCAR